AIDKAAILKDVYQGAGQSAKNLIPPTLWSYNDKVEDYKYDPAKAKALLAQAGYPNGFDIELYAYRERDYAEAVVGYLRAVGIRAKLNFLKYAALRELNRAGKVPIYFQTWGSFS
ncbi:hypothetical protein J8J27_24265, partial [Mycobacterium tuberculosis]|nr:hypothetical protein [Mycobacterium tuberculosis]